MALQSPIYAPAPAVAKPVNQQITLTPVYPTGQVSGQGGPRMADPTNPWYNPTPKPKLPTAPSTPVAINQGGYHGGAQVNSQGQLPYVPPTAPSHVAINQGNYRPDQGQTNSQGAVVVPAVEPTQSLPKSTGTLLNPLETAALTQNTQWAAQQNSAQQQAQAEQLRQQSQGLSAEAQAGLLAQNAATGQQTLMDQIKGVTNSMYGSALTRATSEQAAAREQWYNLINANAGNERLLTQTIDAALHDMPNDTWLQAVKANPALMSTLTNKARLELSTANRDSATQYLLQTVDPIDQESISTGFDGWLGLRYAQDDAGLDAESQAWGHTWTPDKQAEADRYEQAFGSKLDPTNPSDLQRLYAWHVYNSDVKTATADLLLQEVSTQLRNSGAEMTPELAHSARQVLGDLDQMFGDDPVTLSGITAEWTGDIDNGPFSIAFTNWSGGERTQADASNPVERKLDTLWREAWKRDPEKMKGMTRQAFASTMAQNVVPTGTELGQYDIDRLMGAIGIKTATEKTASEDVATMPPSQLVERAGDVDWWASHSTQPRRPSYDAKGVGTNWSGRTLKAAYEKNGFTPGALINFNNGQYRVGDIYTKLDDSGDNTLVVYMHAIDATTGRQVTVKLGRHDTW